MNWPRIQYVQILHILNGYNLRLNSYIPFEFVAMSVTIRLFCELPFRAYPRNGSCITIKSEIARAIPDDFAAPLTRGY
jgi:hypothetical protein